MKLKGRKKLNKAITKAVREMVLDDNIKCRLDNSWWYVNGRVGFSLLEDERAMSRWVNWIKGWSTSEIVQNTFMLSLLHEIGHYMTVDQFMNDQPEAYEKSRADEENIEKLLEEEIDNFAIDHLNIEYHRLPHEMLATIWAIDFYDFHLDRVERCYIKIAKAVVKFYAKNGMDADGNEIGA